MIKVLSTLISWAQRGSASPSGSYSHSLVTLVLRLVHSVLEESGEFFVTSQSLMALVKDDLCFLLLEASRKARETGLCFVLRIFFLLLVYFRTELKMQIEVIVNSIYFRLATPDLPKVGDFSKSSNRIACHFLSVSDPFVFHTEISPDIRLVLLDGLMNCSRMSWFFRELIVNYDCDWTCSNVFNNLMRVLCYCAYPTKGTLDSSNLLALKTLKHILSNIASDFEGSIESLSPVLADSLVRKDRICECLEIFKEKPVKGIAMLLTLKMDDSLSDERYVAHFLRYCVYVPRDVVGTYISINDTFAAKVRKEFVLTFDFSNRSIDSALRQFLEIVRLPKEAQQIDRLIQSFSSHFFSQNPSIFKNEDAVHLIAVSLLMLHTVTSFPDLLPYHVECFQCHG
jgi:brefeldin A-resistance guanine nucleotide exchange factor 1